MESLSSEEPPFMCINLKSTFTPENHIWGRESCCVAHLDKLIDCVDVEVIIEDDTQMLCIRRDDFVAGMQRSDPVFEFPVVYFIVAGQGSMKFNFFYDGWCQGIETYI